MTEQITGRLHVHQDEGNIRYGYWALMDENGISKVPDPALHLSVGSEVFHPTEPKRQGKVLEVQPRDEYSHQSRNVAQVEWIDGDQTEHEAGDLLHERWSYGGLVILRSWDLLQIAPSVSPAQVIWSGVLKLIEAKKQIPGARHVHQEIPLGVDLEAWAEFFYSGEFVGTVERESFADKNVMKRDPVTFADLM